MSASLSGYPFLLTLSFTHFRHTINPFLKQLNRRWRDYLSTAEGKKLGMFRQIPFTFRNENLIWFDFSD